MSQLSSVLVMKWTASRFESVKGLLFVCVIIVLLEGGKRSRSRDHQCCTVSIYKVAFFVIASFFTSYNCISLGMTWRNQQTLHCRILLTRFSHFKTTLHGQKNWTAPFHLNSPWCFWSQSQVAMLSALPNIWKDSVVLQSALNTRPLLPSQFVS